MPNRWIATFPQQDGKVFIFDRYGIAPSVVMRDPRLSIGAKAVYAYLMTYVNSDQVKDGDVKAWPSRDRMMSELGISVNTLTKYIRELRDAGLIDVEQTREKVDDRRTVYSRNIYVIHPFIPDPSQSHKNCDPDTEVSVTNPVTLKSCDTQKVNPSNTRSLSITNKDSKTRQDKTVQSRPFITFEAYFERPPSPTESRTLDRLARTYGEDMLDAAFTEYAIQSDLQEITVPLRYIEGVLENWSVEGMRLTDVKKHLRRMKDDNSRR